MLRFTRRGHSAALAVVVVAVLSGCSAGPVEAGRTAPARTPSAIVTPSPTPTSTPTPTPALDPADPSTWIITSTAIGPADLGVGDQEFVDAIAPSFKLDNRCEGLSQYSAVQSASGLGMYSGYDVAARGMGNAAVFAEGDPTAPMKSSPHTQSGIILGSSLDELKNAYPQLGKWSDPGADPSEQRGEWYLVTQGPGSIMFLVINDRVGSIQVTTALPPVGFCS